MPPDATFALYAMLEPAPGTPLSDQIKVTQDQFGAMFEAGELDPLPTDTRAMLHGLRIAMLAWGAAAFELERRHVVAADRMPCRFARWINGRNA